MSSSAVSVSDVRFRYGEREALRGVSLEVPRGAIFGLLGPNGSGKSTLVKILTTLLPLQSGQVSVGGHDLASEPDAVRRQIGVTFQAPSLDIKLTVAENLRFQGNLYGLSGKPLSDAVSRVAGQLSIEDRLKDTVQSLSGGLKRRVEIAKCLLHEPAVLLLDEPSTGLDPGARHEMWRSLEQLVADAGVTVLVTTHLMDEAERCGQLVILDEGRVIAEGRPDELRSSIGGDCVTIEALDVEHLSAAIREKFSVEPQQLGETLRVEHEAGPQWIADLASAFPGQFRSVTLGKPTLEDVFIRLTGRSLEVDTDEQTA